MLFDLELLTGDVGSDISGFMVGGPEGSKTPHPDNALLDYALEDKRLEGVKETPAHGPREFVLILQVGDDVVLVHTTFIRFRPFPFSLARAICSPASSFFKSSRAWANSRAMSSLNSV